MRIESMVYCTRIGAARTAKDLEDEHLHDQIVSASLIARTLIDETTGLDPREPALRMWTGYEHALCVWGMLYSMEFGQTRGYADEEFWKLRTVLEKVQRAQPSYVAPPWMRDKDVMRSHRSVLARIYPDDYEDAWPGTPELMPVLWPFVDDEGGYELYISKSEQRLLKTGERKLSDEILSRVANLI